MAPLTQGRQALENSPNLLQNLATEKDRETSIPTILGWRHLSILTKLLPTTLIILSLLLLLISQNYTEKIIFHYPPNITTPQDQNFSEIMESPKNQTETTPGRQQHSIVPEDEADSIQVIRSRQDLLEGSLDKRVLVGKLIAQKQPNKASTKSSIRNLWKDYDLTQISEVSNGVLMFTFKNDQQADKALSDGPWFVLGNLLSVQELLPGKSVSEVKYNLVPIWLQVHGIPFSFLNIDSVRAIVERVGSVYAIEYPIVEGKALRSFTRVRIAIDISKPLWAGSWITLENESKVWVVFKYEKLQGLCFNCGILGHEQRFCLKPKVMAPFDKQKPKFGMFLSVDTPKPLSLTVNEGSTQSQYPSPNPNLNQYSPTNLRQTEGMGEEQDQLSEGQNSNDSARLNLRKRGNEGVNSRREKSCEGTKVGRSMEREELLANVVEGFWLGDLGVRHQSEGIIDLTSDAEMDLTLSLENTISNLHGQNWAMVDVNKSRSASKISKGKAPLLEIYQMEKGGPSRPFTRYTSPANIEELENEYTISLPKEDSPQVSKDLMKQLDKVSEQELIQTWNSRFHLKRGREDLNGLEEVETEMVRRKKFKRESWYDAEGNVICVAITSEFGNQTYIMDEEGYPKPPTN